MGVHPQPLTSPGWIYHQEECRPENGHCPCPLPIYLFSLVFFVQYCNLKPGYKKMRSFNRIFTFKRLRCAQDKMCRQTKQESFLQSCKLHQTLHSAWHQVSHTLTRYMTVNPHFNQGWYNNASLKKVLKTFFLVFRMLFLLFTKYNCHQTKEIMRAVRIFRNFQKNRRFWSHSRFAFAFVNFGIFWDLFKRNNIFYPAPQILYQNGRKILTGGVGNIVGNIISEVRAAVAHV